MGIIVNGVRLTAQGSLHAPWALSLFPFSINKEFLMCEAHAFILKDEEEEKVLESVDIVELEGDEVKLVSIFGEQKTLKARLKLYNNTKGKIVFEAI